MSIEENKKLVRRYFKEAPHNPDVCDEIFAPKILFHTIQHSNITPQTMASDPLSEKIVYDSQKETWSPDWGMSIDEIIAEGNRVVVQWTFRGKHIGDYAGLPPTNKQVRYSGINIFRIENNRIAEVWDISDRLWLWQQLGVLPEIKDSIVAIRSIIEAENFNKRTINDSEKSIVEEKKAKSRIKKLSRMCILCYKNCLRLHNDSILMFKNGRYPTAYAVSVIALEEMGKYNLLSHGLFYGYFDKQSDEKFIEGVLQDTYDHRSKQNHFMGGVLDDDIADDFSALLKKGIDYQKIFNENENDLRKVIKSKWGKYFPKAKRLFQQLDAFERYKHESLYVGFPKMRGKVDLSGRLISPFNFSEKKVENQITYLNDHLLYDALGVIKGFSGLDFEELENMITPKYVARLRRTWPKMLRKNKSKILAAMKMPNEKGS